MTDLRGPFLLDLDGILAPLASGGGCGADLRDLPDTPFHAIDEARRQDDGLPQGVWVAERKAADWDRAAALCQQVLVHRSKDVRVAAWLADALVHRDGFAGLAPGLAVVEALCRAFWDGLHPRPDEDGDLSGRINAVALLNSRLPQALRTVPLTRSGQGESVALSWGDFETARLIESRGQRQGALTVAAFEASAFATPVAVLERLRTEVEAALAVLDRLDRFLDEACRREAPSLEALRTLLHDIRGWLGNVVPAPAESSATAPDQPTMSQSDPPPAAASGGPIASREEAYRRLAEVADYLMRTEPHSPTPYVLRRVQGWGRMPLDLLLIDMAHGRNDLASILELIAPKDGE